MATYASRQDIAQEIVASIDASFTTERSARTTDPRPHVSELTKCLIQSWRARRSPRTDGPTTENMTTLRGHAWDAIADRAAAELERSGKSITHYVSKIRVETAWAVGEMDVLAKVDGVWTVIDNKTTAAGMKQDAPTKWPHYVEQVAAYAVMYGGIYQAALSVLHLPMPTTFRVWLIRFTSRELDRWSAELQRRAALVTGDVEPSLQEHADWECGYCPFAVKKGGDCAGFGYGRPGGFFVVDQEVAA